ncbi:DUF2905 domain-containing protein [Bacillus timonensis]|nr:DUF2905 domain-containing protein [Bacillus timonensis]
MGKMLVIVGIILVIVGMMFQFIGKLPGDIVVKKGNTTFYFPIVTSVIISVILSIVFFVFGKFK